MPQGKKDVIPPGVEHAMLIEAASTPKGSPGLATQLARDYGLSDRVAKLFLTREREKIDDLRGQSAESLMVLLTHASARLQEKLSDDEEMAKTPVRDLATAIHKLGDTAVTLADGHKPQIALNIGSTLALEKEIAQWDAALKPAKPL